VIDVTAEIGPMKDCILIYVYRARASQKVPVPELPRATAGPAHDDEQAALDEGVLRAR